jgi:hypothetical protein
MLFFAIILILIIGVVAVCHRQGLIPKVSSPTTISESTVPIITVPNRVRYIQLQQTETSQNAIPMTIREIEVIDERGYHVDIFPEQIQTNGQDPRYQVKAVVDGNKRENNGLYLKSSENVLGMALIDLGHPYDLRKIVLTPWTLPIAETMVQAPNTLKVLDEYRNELFCFDVPVDADGQVLTFDLLPEITKANSIEPFENVVHQPTNYWRMLSDEPCGRDGIVTTGDCRSP